MPPRWTTSLLFLACAASVASANSSVVTPKTAPVPNKDAGAPWLLEQAKDAERQGSLELAASLYARAAEQTAQDRDDGADTLYLKAADLFLAATPTDSAHGIKLYGQAIAVCNLAIEQNPANLTAHQRLLNLEYDLASLSSSTTGWTHVEKCTGDLLKFFDEHPAEALKNVPLRTRACTCLAEAQIDAALYSNKTGIDRDRLAAAERTVEKAAAISPDTPQVVLLQAKVLQIRADLDRRTSSMQADALRQSAFDSLQSYLAKNPNTPEIVQWYALSLYSDHQEAAARKLLDHAITAHPDNTPLVSTLATRIAKKEPDAAEKLYLGLVAAHPKDPDAYFALADFYQQASRPREAAEAYQQVLDRQQLEGGIAIFHFAGRNSGALFNLSWLSMDRAETLGLKTKEGAAAFAQALAFANKTHVPDFPSILADLLEGRIQLVKNNPALALVPLLRVETAVKDQVQRIEWRQVINLLAITYNRRSEWGNELKYLDQYLAVFPKTTSVILRKAQALNKCARYQEALNLVTPLAHPKPEDKIPLETSTAAAKIEAEAHTRLGDNEKARDTLTNIIPKETPPTTSSPPESTLPASALQGGLSP